MRQLIRAVSLGLTLFAFFFLFTALFAILFSLLVYATSFIEIMNTKDSTSETQGERFNSVSFE